MALPSAWSTQYLYNEDIHWEKTNKLEAALEFGLLQQQDRRFSFLVP